MKLPRWLMIAMVTSSVLAVLATLLAAGWWWVTWPERTAREFVQLIAGKRLEEANRMTSFQLDYSDPGRWNVQRYDLWKDGKLRCHTRSWLEVVRGHQEFRLGKVGLKFTVNRGKVIPSDPMVLILVERQSGLVIGPDRIRLVDPSFSEEDLAYPLKRGGVGRVNLLEVVDQWIGIMYGPPDQPQEKE